MTDFVPEHPSLAVRRRIYDRRREPFEPVRIDGDTRKLTWSRIWNAVWPSALGIGSLLYVALLTWAYVEGYANG